MEKRKCDWCYFTDGSKKKITNWYKSGEDILFFIDGKIYLYKQDCFGFEELSPRARQNLIYPIFPRGKFYIHRSPTLFYNSDRYDNEWYDKNNYDEWAVTNIEKIELRY